jgi:hypothetical protein
MTRINQQGSPSRIVYASLRVGCGVPPQRILFDGVIFGKVRDRENALANTRDACATRSDLGTLLAQRFCFPFSEHQLEVRPAIQLTQRVL